MDNTTNIQSVDADGNVVYSQSVTTTIDQLQSDVSDAQVAATAAQAMVDGQNNRKSDAQLTIQNADEQLPALEDARDKAAAKLTAKVALLSAAQAQMPQ